MEETPMESSEPEKRPAGNTPQEQFEQRARAMASRAAHGGKGVHQAALATWKGANTVAEKMLIGGGIVGIISFFLPWISGSFFGASIAISGLEVARRGQTAYWLFPVMMAAALLLGWLNLQGDPKKRILNARWLILIGAAWAWIWVNTFLAANSENAVSAGVGFGGYLSFLASLLVLISGIMQIQENIRALTVHQEKTT